MTADKTMMEQYLGQLQAVLNNLSTDMLAEICGLLKQARAEDRKIFIFGNGGSAATASHMACDFGKNTRSSGRGRMRVICLNDNIPALSAYANDEGYEVIFAEPLKSLADPGDVVIAISGSGNSPNVLNGVRAAREMGIRTIGLTGFAGGELAGLVDHCLVVPSNSMEQIEDVHMIIDHMLTMILKQS